MPYNHERHDEVYRQCFKNADEGHALYKPVSSVELKPGMCGFFNLSGDWRSIQDLNKKEEVTLNGWKPVEDIKVTTDPGEDFWPAMKSTWMVSYPIKLAVSANIPTAPVSLGFKIGSDSQESAGAVLVTEGSIGHHQIDPKSSTRVKNWFISNAKKILTDYEVTRKKGIWIITSTYTAKRRAHAMLHSREASVSFEINAQVPGVATAAPSGGWWNRMDETVWKNHRNDDGIVLFMTGWYWRPTFTSRKANPTEDMTKQKMFLGHGSQASVSEYRFKAADSIEHVSLPLNPEKIGEFDEEELQDE